MSTKPIDHALEADFLRFVAMKRETEATLARVRANLERHEEAVSMSAGAWSGRWSDDEAAALYTAIDIEREHEARLVALLSNYSKTLDNIGARLNAPGTYRFRCWKTATGAYMCERGDEIIVGAHEDIRSHRDVFAKIGDWLAVVDPQADVEIVWAKAR